ncbi:MAG: nucleotidyltransferase family protein [Pseudomonadota bacterium]
MAKQKIEHGFILAAGKGTRLRPYTDHLPKPMVSVWGKPIIAHTVEKLMQEGVQKVTINLFYLGDRIKNYFSRNNAIPVIFSEETELLDTGGGVLNALSTMEDKAFFLINGDALWEDDETSSTSSLEDLSREWDEEKMDILLLLQPVTSMNLTQGVGDYDLDSEGRAKRNHNQKGQYMFTGVRITHPHIFKGLDVHPFSFLELMDKAEAHGRLYGQIHKGIWHHINTAEDLEAVNKAKGYEIKAESSI